MTVARQRNRWTPAPRALSLGLGLAAAFAVGTLPAVAKQKGKKPPPEFHVLDETLSVMFGACPGTVELQRPIVVTNAAPIGCPPTVRELYRGILVSPTSDPADGRCWFDAEQDGPAPSGMTELAKCAVCWGPNSARPCVGGGEKSSKTRYNVSECGEPIFGKSVRLGEPGSVRLTGASVTQYGATSCPTRESLDADPDVPAKYQAKPYELLYSGKVYKGPGNALAGQCWESPPAAGAWTELGDCVVCQ